MSPNSRELKVATSLRSPLKRGMNFWTKLIISPGFTSLKEFSFSIIIIFVKRYFASIFVSANLPVFNRLGAYQTRSFESELALGQSD
jgi:hypothetical protein